MALSKILTGHSRCSPFFLWLSFIDFEQAQLETKIQKCQLSHLMLRLLIECRKFEIFLCYKTYPYTVISGRNFFSLATQSLPSLIASYHANILAAHNLPLKSRFHLYLSHILSPLIKFHVFDF